MTAGEASFEALRSMLQQPPSEALFERLYSLYPGGEASEAEHAHLSDVLARWDPMIPRKVPHCWLRNFQLAPLVIFCNTLEEPYVDMPYAIIGVEGAQIVTRSPYLANLTALDLLGNKLGPEGAQALAQSPSLANLTSLNLYKSRIGAEGARALAQSPYLANLTSLDLQWNLIGDEGARALAQSPYLANLTSLDLSGNHISDEGAQALAQSPYLANLTSFNLLENWIGLAGEQALNQSPYLKIKVAPGVSAGFSWY